MLTCENCGQEMDSKLCPFCDGYNLKDSRYCSYCGDMLPDPDEIDEEEGGELDMGDRILCADDTCIGIIENGVCSECGRAEAS